MFVLWGSGGGKYNRPCVCVRFCACVCCMLRYTRALNGVTLLPRWKRNLALAHLPRTSMELSHRGGGLSWARMYQRKTCGSQENPFRSETPSLVSFWPDHRCVLRLGVDPNEARSNRVRISVSRPGRQTVTMAGLYCIVGGRLVKGSCASMFCVRRWMKM